jgi:drug/metabolite transporter (DMT)-like permease
MIWGALIVVYVVWGSTYLAIRVVVETMPPLLSGSIRFLVAGVASMQSSSCAADRACCACRAPS